MRRALLFLPLAGCLLASPALAEGQWHMADQYYDPAAMAAAKKQLQHHEGGQSFLFLEADRLEYQQADDSRLFVWDTQGWFGGDLNRLWLKSEGEYDIEGHAAEDAELQALYSRAVSPFFDLQAGVRQDFAPGPDRTYGAIGIQGLAPQWFEIDAAAFIGEDGDMLARFEAEYDLFLTQRLVLQPRTELNFAAQDIPETGTGAGLSTAEAGLRLRYEITREIAPYVGVAWQRSFGATADYAEAEGEDTEAVSFVAGLRLWY